MQTNLKSLQKKCKSIIETTTILMAGGLGEGEPFIDDEEVWFNGMGDNGYETFGLSIDDTEMFVNTNQKLYDEVVVACMLAAQNAFTACTFSSDGDANDHEKSFELYKKACILSA